MKRRSAMSVTTLMALVLAIATIIFLAYLLWKIWFAVNYKGRLQCKFAYSIASTVTSTLDNVELAKLAVATGMGGYTFYKTGLFSQVKEAAKDYLAKRYVKDSVVQATLLDFEETAKAIERESPNILKALTRNKGSIAKALGTILVGATTYYAMGQLLNPITNIARTFVPKVISVCRPLPEDIKPPLYFIDRGKGYKCSAMDVFFKNTLLPRYYDKLKKKLGDCERNKKEWERAFNDAYLAYYAMVTFEESLRGANVGVPVEHYRLLLDDPKVHYKYGEGDIVCWWKMILYSTNKSFYDEIYNKTKKEYIPINPSSYEGNSICWEILDDVDHLSKNDLLSNGGDTLDVLSVFGDPNFCNKYPTICNNPSSSSGVENYIEWGNSNQTYILVGMALGKVFVVFDYFK